MDRAEEIFNRIIEYGEAAVDEFILTRASEELFLDFKRSSDAGSSRVLSETDRNNLAKAISGFGNSEGGVVVWGIDCSKGSDGADIAKLKVPVSDAKKFQGWIEGAISGCTVPPHSGVRNFAVICGQSLKGFVATYIPKSDHAPHQMVGKLQYYIRAGSDFVPTPHQVLAGMFGKRPQPRIYPLYLTQPPHVDGDVIHGQLGLVVRNGGPVIAKEVFVNVFIRGIGGRSRIAFQIVDETRWSGTTSFGNCHVSVVTNSGVCLPPEAQFQPLVLHLTLVPPFTDELHVECLMGANGSSPFRVEFRTKAEDLAQIYSDYLNAEGADRKAFIPRAFSLPKPDSARIREQ